MATDTPLAAPCRLPRRSGGQVQSALPSRLAGGIVEGQLRWLSDSLIPDPALVFELDVLDGHGIRVGIEIGQRLILRHPAPEDVVGDDLLTRFVEDVDQDVLTEVLERYLFAAIPGLGVGIVPHLVRPLLELGVMGNAALERDGLKLGATRRFAGAALVSAVAELNDFGGSLQRADLA